MSIRHEPWSPGTPCWVDYGASDIDTAKRFYGELLGWEYSGGDPQYGGYVNAHAKGEIAAGLAPKMDPSQPSAWTTYFAVADADEAAARVREAGGTVVVEPMDVEPFGRMAIAIDPTGAGFGLWQAKQHTGAQIVNEPGSLVWNEAHLTDPEAGRAFYQKVFGYSYAEVEGAGDAYRTFATSGDMLGGIGGMEPGEPAAALSHWVVYFMVQDADAAAATVTEHGGTVLSGPTDTPYGRMVTVTDPEGAVLTVSGPPPEQ